MRRSAVRLATLLALALLLTFSAAASSISVTVRGVPVVWSGASPYVTTQGSTLTPVRDAAEAMGLTVRWVQNQQMVELSRTYTPDNSVYQAELQSGQKEFISSRTMRLWIGKNTYTTINQYAFYDGRTITNTRSGQVAGSASVAPVLQNGQTFVAIRPVAEQFGYDVIWDQAEQTVRIVNGLACDWSYAWTVASDADGGLLIGVHAPVNLLSASITGLSVRSTTLSGTSEEQCSFRDATGPEQSLLQAAAGTDAELLDAVRVAYPFEPGESYAITVTLTATKSNGAVTSVSGTFQISLSTSGNPAMMA